MRTTVPDSLQLSVDSLSTYVTEIFGDALIAMSVYGSVQREDFDPKNMLVPSVIVVKAVTADQVSELASHGQYLSKNGFAPPLVLSESDVASSLDTFPLEFIEIHQSQIVVAGKSPFTELSVEREHVRLQCERELKVLLIGMRHGILTAAGKEKQLAAVAADAAANALRIMRGILWLHNQEDALPAAKLLPAVSEVTGIELGALNNILTHGPTGNWAEYTDFYRIIEALGGCIDAS